MKYRGAGHIFERSCLWQCAAVFSCISGTMSRLHLAAQLQE